MNFVPMSPSTKARAKVARSHDSTSGSSRMVKWGLLAIEDSEGQEWMEDGQVHWVGTNIGHIYAQTTLPSTSSTWEDGDDAEADGFWHQDDRGGYTWWQQEADGEFYHLDNGGTYWPWSEQAFWSATPEEQKEIQEAYAAYENKVRSLHRQPGP